MFKFGDFSLEPAQSVLFYKGQRVKDITRKQLQVLSELLRRPGILVSYDEMITSIWPDNRHGATAARINQYVSKLNRTLTSLDPDSVFIENVRGTGYIFIAPVTYEAVDAASLPQTVRRPTSGHQTRNLVLAVSALALLIMVVLAAVWSNDLFPENDEAEIRNVVQQSQLFEFTELFGDPLSFREEMLDQFWTKDYAQDRNYDRRTIRTLVKKLTDEQRYYGPESRNERFEFQQVDISSSGDEAVVKTLEKWFIAEYRQNDRTLIRNRTIGPYFVSYILRKVDGKWLVERSNTARTVRPTPVLESVTVSGTGNEGLTATVVGKDIEPETVSVELKGQTVRRW